jgi:hypothetical protein
MRGDSEARPLPPGRDAARLVIIETHHMLDAFPNWRNGCANILDVIAAVLENDGKISVIRQRRAEPDH